MNAPQFCEDEGCLHHGTEHICSTHYPLQSATAEKLLNLFKAARGMNKPDLVGARADYVIIDSLTSWRELYEHKDFELDRDLIKPRSRFHGWKQPIPTTQEHFSAAPSDAKRVLLRAKRKKRK